MHSGPPNSPSSSSLVYINPEFFMLTIYAIVPLNIKTLLNHLNVIESDNWHAKAERNFAHNLLTFVRMEKDSY